MSLAALDESSSRVSNTRLTQTIPTDPPDTLYPTASVRRRYGGNSRPVSHMWIERKIRNDPDFPEPTYIAGRRYWRLGELIEWERKCATRTPQKTRRGVAA